MPWLEISPMDQRKQLIKDYQRGLQSVTELADRFEISRKTVYKWIDRHELDGANGLVNHSRRPRSCPHATAQGIVDAVLDARRHHPRWGAKKLLRILRRKDPRETWPGRSSGSPSSSTACRTSSAPTAASHSPRRRSAACRCSRCGGSGSGSTRN